MFGCDLSFLRFFFASSLLMPLNGNFFSHSFTFTARIAIACKKFKNWIFLTRPTITSWNKMNEWIRKRCGELSSSIANWHLIQLSLAFDRCKSATACLYKVKAPSHAKISLSIFLCSHTHSRNFWHFGALLVAMTKKNKLGTQQLMLINPWSILRLLISMLSIIAYLIERCVENLNFIGVKFKVQWKWWKIIN